MTSLTNKGQENGDGEGAPFLHNREGLVGIDKRWPDGHANRGEGGQPTNHGTRIIVCDVSRYFESPQERMGGASTCREVADRGG